MLWLRLNGTETLKEKTGSAPGRGITLTRTQDLLACKILEAGGAQQNTVFYHRRMREVS